jgi:hypothetical protein
MADRPAPTKRAALSLLSGKSLRSTDKTCPSAPANPLKGSLLAYPPVLTGYAQLRIPAGRGRKRTLTNGLANLTYQCRSAHPNTMV